MPELVDSLPVITKALIRRKVTPGKALRSGHKAPKDVKAIYERVENRGERYELNLYISGYDEDDVPGTTGGQAAHAQNAAESGLPGQSPEESPAR